MSHGERRPPVPIAIPGTDGQGGIDDAWSLGIDVPEVTRILRRHLRLIVATGLLAAGVAAGVSLMIPNVYDASVTLMPNEAGGARAMDLGKATDLAQAVGISLPGRDGASAYATVVTSRRVLEHVLARPFFQPRLGMHAPLDSLFRADAKTPAQGRASALAWLHESIRTDSDSRTGIWTVTVRHRSPETAAGIANAIVAEAERVRRMQSTEEAASTRAFIETRMDSTRTRLRAAEEALKAFRAQNVRINKSPELLLREGRLLRDARIQEEIFLTLTRQYELAKIDEAYHQPELVVLDPAVPPVFKAGPMRTRSALGAFVLGMLAAAAVSVVRAYRPGSRPAAADAPGTATAARAS